MNSKKMKAPLIALLTDFGEQDYYVASVKAVILGVNPRARIVDISHQIPSFNIEAAGFVLFAVYKYFPTGTIFLTIVDPGVGSGRKVLLVRTRRHYFIAPDNGVLTLVLLEEKIEELREVAAEKFFLADPSKTFEGRDKMAPAAGWLSRGKRADEFGPIPKHFNMIDVRPALFEQDGLSGQILYTDKFGNLITNIRAGMVESLARRKKMENLILLAGRKKVGGFKECFAAAKKGELFFTIGSLGLVEIASREGSASARIRPRRGEVVKIRSKVKA